MKEFPVKQEFEFHADSLPGHVNPDDEAERLPINYIQLALKYKWWLAGGLLIGGVLGHAMYLKAGPEYEAFAQILVSRKYMPPVRESERMLQDTGKPSEHIPLILSPMIAEKAVEIGQLKDLPTFQGEPDLAEIVLDGLKVKRISGQDRSHFNVLDVRYPSRKASDARKVVESVIAAYDKYLIQQSKEHSSEVLALAQKTTADLLNKIHEKESEYQDFLQTVPEEFRSALGPKTQSTQTTNLAPEDIIHSLGEERNRNRIRQAELMSRQKNIEGSLSKGEPRDAVEAEVKRYMNMDGRAGDQATRRTEISIYQSQLLPLILREQELARTFGPDYPELVSVRKSIEKVLETFNRLGVQLPDGIEAAPPVEKPKERIDYIATYLDSVRRQLAELDLKDRELEMLIKQEGRRSREFAGYRATDQNLRVELTQLHELWQKRLDREGEVAIEKDTNGYSLKTLAPVKDALVLKRMMKFYAGGSMFGVFVVAVVCLLRELRDLTLKTVRDVRVTLHQPVLGSVVAFETPQDHLSVNAPHPALRYLVAPHSIEAENYRSIRTAVLIASEQHSARVILVSSPEPGDGKTTLVSNLAIALAQSGKRVLLIDGDLRRPTIHQLFRVKHDIGLADVLAGEIEIHNAMLPTTINGLTLLPAGRTPQNPAELLSSPRLHQAIRDVRDDFDFVFVDAPPLLVVSDPCILARQTDGMLIVARINKNTRSAAVRVRELIENHGIRIVGAVANGAELGKGRSDTYYGEYVSAAPKVVPGPGVEKLREMIEV